MTDKTSTEPKSYNDIEFDPRFVPEGKDCASCGAVLTSYPDDFCGYHANRRDFLAGRPLAAEVDKGLDENAGSDPFIEHMAEVMQEESVKQRAASMMAASMMAAILGVSPSQERSRRISPVEAILSAITKGGVPSNVQASIDRISASPQGQEMLNTKLFEMIFAQDKKKYWHKEILENLVRIEPMLKSSVNIFDQFDLSQSAAYHIEEGRKHIEKAIMILQGVLNPPEKTPEEQGADLEARGQA